MWWQELVHLDESNMTIIKKNGKCDYNLSVVKLKKLI